VVQGSVQKPYKTGGSGGRRSVLIHIQAGSVSHLLACVYQTYY